MSVLIRGMKMPQNGFITITVASDGRVVGNAKKENGKFEDLDNEVIAKAAPVPPHGRLIDADALMKDGWVLQKQVMRMGGYAIHEMPLNNPNIPIIIEAEGESGGGPCGDELG